MASAQGQSANLDLFDAYFRRADLDRDGQISGNEADAFFQGSGLPKQVLEQTWAHAGQRQTGFLGRAEFILQSVRKSSRPTSRNSETQKPRGRLVSLLIFNVYNFILQLVRKSRPISRHPEYRNWRSVL